MKKLVNKKMLLAALPIFLFVVVYLTGLIAEGKARMGSLMLGAAAEPTPMTFHPIKVFTYAFNEKHGIVIMMGIAAIFGFMLLKIVKGYINIGTLDKERNFKYADSGAYGTAKWLSEEDLHKVAKVTMAEEAQGIILGQLDESGKKLVSTDPNSRLNKHIAVFGASGTGKSRCFSRNYFIQAAKRRESVIVTDPKGELFEDSAEFFRQEGYIVKVLNLVNLEKSDSWNCLKEIDGDEIMASIYVDTIIKNTSNNGGGGGDHFWDNAEMNLLKALVLRVERGLVYKRDNIQSMGTVYDILTNSGAKQMEKLFDPDRLAPEEKGCVAPYNIFKEAGDNLRGGIIIGLGTRLQVFQNEVIKRITAEDDIDLTLPGKKPCAYFCIMSDQDSTLNFLSSLFFSFLFIKLVRYANLNGGKCDVPVNFILDEFPNIGQIVDFTKKISTVRSRGLNISVIFQTISQLENRYPDGQWKEILGNCDTHLFLGCTDQDTAEYISKRCGEITINVNSTQAFRTSRLNPLYTDEQRESFGEGKRMLMNMDEVMTMPLDESLIIFRGQNVLKSYKYDYSNNPQASKFIPSRIADYPSIYDTERRAEMKERERILTGQQITVNADEIELTMDDPEVSVSWQNVEILPASGENIEGEVKRTYDVTIPTHEEEDEDENANASRAAPTRMLYGREIGSSAEAMMDGTLIIEKAQDIQEETNTEDEDNAVEFTDDDLDLDINSILAYQEEVANTSNSAGKGLSTKNGAEWFDESGPSEEDFVPAGVTSDGLAIKKRNN